MSWLTWNYRHTLSRKKAYLNNSWGDWEHLGDNFYISTQNGSKLEIRPDRFFIHTLQLKLWPFQVFPCLYRKPCVCNVFRPRATWGAGPRAHINVTTITHFGQNWCIGCLLALYDYTMHLAQFSDFRTIFFCLVCGLLEKKPRPQTFGHVMDAIDRALERLQLLLKMTSAGNLSIFLHDNIICGHKDSWTPNTFQPVKVRFIECHAY